MHDWVGPRRSRDDGRERDEAAILDWQSKEFPRIALEAQQRDAHLVFLDESGFMLTPSVRRTWGPRGKTPILDAFDRRDRISAISSISVSPHNRRLNLHFDLLPDNTTVHAEDVVAYLRQLKAQLRAPLTVIWDNSTLHDKSKLVCVLGKPSGNQDGEIAVVCPRDESGRIGVGLDQVREAWEPGRCPHGLAAGLPDQRVYVRPRTS